ncbi:putative glycosyl transferase, family 14 [Dioscorea sansibarensis]
MKVVMIRGLREVREYCKPCMVSLLLLFISLSGVILSSHLIQQLTKLPLMDMKLSPSPSCNCSSGSSVSGDVWHTMEDEDLLQRASMVVRAKDCDCQRTEKVAFLFLTRGRLPLMPLWEMFFKGQEKLLFYSIYVHSSPEFTEEPPKNSVFFQRRIPSKAVEWGRTSMVDAERRLLANALLDLSNQHFILLSETCIPLFNFSIVYQYITKSSLSFLSSYDDPKKTGRGRYNKLMMPAVTLQQWRKGSQWFHLQRKLAIEVVSEHKYYLLFKQHCQPPCYMDEHYLPTLVTMFFPEFNSNRSITFVDWSRGGSHPVTFKHRDVSEKLLQSIKHGSNCTYNGDSTTLCFLFARKFDPSTLGPLVKITPTVLGVDV